MKKLRISSVKPLGKQRVYNIEMKGDQHNYILENGLISKNSHACSYSLLSYWTMFLKIKFPLEFMTAALEAESEEKKRRGYIKEAKRLGISVTAPDINNSGNSFTIDPNAENRILCGLLDVKGLGQKSVDNLLENRPFDSLQDLLVRTKASKTVVGALLKIGALDSLVDNAKKIELNLKEVLKHRRKKDFAERFANIEWIDCYDYTETERDNHQLDLLALPPKVHPSVEWQLWALKRLRIPVLSIEHLAIGELRNPENSSRLNLFCGFCTRIQYFDSDGERICKMTLEDGTGSVALTPKDWRLVGEDKLVEGELFYFIACAGYSGQFKAHGSVLVPLSGFVASVENGGVDPRYSFLIDDPFGDVWDELDSDSISTFSDFSRNAHFPVYIIGVTRKVSRKGKPYWILACLDFSGEMREVLVWRDGIRRHKRKLVQGALLSIRLKRDVSKEGKLSFFLNEDRPVRQIGIAE